MFTTVIDVTVLAYLVENLITPASTPNIYLCPRPTPRSHIRALRHSLLNAPRCVPLTLILPHPIPLY